MNKSHLTAITRSKPSKPFRLLHGSGLIQGETLDYGCGRGFDADWYKVDGYDPHYRPDSTIFTKKYNTVVCNYVLNVVHRDEAVEILNRIWNLLHIGGSAFITVRRDLKQDEVHTSKGTYQWLVYLDLPVIHKENDLWIYQMKRNTQKPNFDHMCPSISKRPASVMTAQLFK